MLSPFVCRFRHFGTFVTFFTFSIFRPARSELLSQADSSPAGAAFEGLEAKPGTFKVVDDPQGKYGKVFPFQTYDGPKDPGYKDRMESRGMRAPDGTPIRWEDNKEYALGWRA